METKSIIFLLVLLSAVIFFVRTVRIRIRWLAIGKPDSSRGGSFDKRIGNVLKVAIGQSKILREPAAGIVHAGIFWGFCILLTAIVESIGEGVFPDFSLSFLGPVYHMIALGGDVMCVIVTIAVVIALLRRYVTGPPRIREIPPGSQKEATLILSAILVIMVTMLLQNAARMALGEASQYAPAMRIVSSQLASLLGGLSPVALSVFFELNWWIHIVLVLAFLNYLPFSKHFHVLTSIPNVYLSNMGITRTGAIAPLDLEDENTETFGTQDVRDFTWKQLLDGYTCTECGRCTAACPANGTGKILSPKKIIVDIRHRLEEYASRSRSDGKENEVDAKHLVSDHITPPELWACTTCRACEQECPVMIEHLSSIIDMRRYLVLMESDFPAELQILYRNLENNYAPWQFSPDDRDKWAEGLAVRTMAEMKNAEEIDYLFWVGCAGSFDERYKKVSRAFAGIMQKAGVSFAILGKEEKCNGDIARRTGNEYLAQMFVRENVQTLRSYGVKKIVTACPHCYHSLRNEFPAFGGEYDVVSHIELIDSLIRHGNISIRKTVRCSATYHDSCYLGRYNELYEMPRDVLRAVPGIELTEMRRSRDRGLCCGAGGGRMFMEETEGKRINIERSEESLSTGAEVIASACPFCMTMLADGVKEVNAESKTTVKDIAEIIWDAMEK